MYGLFRTLFPKKDSSHGPGRTGEGSLLIGNGVDLEKPTQLQPIFVTEEHRKRGMLVVGTTGIGKTRLEEGFVEHDIRTGKSVVVFDPKCDQGLFSKIYQVARNTGRLEDLQLITVLYPEHSAKADPMAYYFNVNELVNHITAALPPSKEEFFRAVAVSLCTLTITGNIIIATHENRVPSQNLDYIRQCTTRDSLEKMRDKLMEIGATTENQEAVRISGMITNLLETDPTHFAKVTMSLQATLMALTTGNVGQVIGQADSNRFIERLEQDKPVILVVHTGAMLSTDASAMLCRLLISMIQGHIGRVYGSVREKLKIPLAIHIDEAQQVLYEGFESLTAMGGSANVLTTLYIQDIAQLRIATKSDDRAKVVANTCNTKIFMRCPDAETAQFVVDHFGTRQVLTGIYGANQITTREIEQEAVKPYEVLSLQAQEFLMLSYSGRFKGTTMDVDPAGVKVVFPAAPVLLDREIVKGEAA